MAKIMYFLTGNAEGFRVSERTILERCNISESGYKRARKKLAEKQWIFHEAGEYIQVNFNKIFSDYRVLQERGTQARSPQEPAQKTVGVDNEKNVSNPSEVHSVQTASSSEETRSGCLEYPHNNISNNIKNKKNSITENSIMVRCEDTRSVVANATTPQASSQPLREKVHTREEIKKAEKEFTAWFNEKSRWIEIAYDLDDGEEYKKMMESDEYKALLKEAEEKREALKKEYGNSIRV